MVARENVLISPRSSSLPYELVPLSMATRKPQAQKPQLPTVIRTHMDTPLPHLVLAAEEISLFEQIEQELDAYGRALEKGAHPPPPLLSLRF